MAETNREAVEKDYLNGMKYKDLADKYGVTINTVKSWKQRYGWNRDEMYARTQKRDAPAPVKEYAPEFPEADELTVEQRLFCEIFDRNHNASQAYAKAYGCSYISAKSNTTRLLRKPAVQAYLKALREYRKEALLLQPDDIVERMMHIAFGDIGDYLKFGQKDIVVDVIQNENGESVEVKKRVNYVDLNDIENVDTAMITEISQGRDGVKIKLADSIKAMQWLMDYFEWNPQNNLRNEFERRKLDLQERAVKAQEDKVKAEDSDKVNEITVEFEDVDASGWSE